MRARAPTIPTTIHTHLLTYHATITSKHNNSTDPLESEFLLSSLWLLYSNNSLRTPFEYVQVKACSNFQGAISVASTRHCHNGVLISVCVSLFHSLQFLSENYNVKKFTKVWINTADLTSLLSRHLQQLS